MEDPEVLLQDFVSCDNLKEIDKLPCHEPADGTAPVIVCAQQGEKTNRFKRLVRVGKGSLNTDRDYASTWSLKDCKRELIQNLIDEVAVGNSTLDNPSFQNVSISKGIRTRGKLKEEVIIFHNATCKLAEIIFNSSKNLFEFINYGTTITQGDKILQYGSSNKRHSPVLTGKYGEGLKRAIVKFISIGCVCHIEGCFPSDPDVDNFEWTYQTWNFYLKGRKVMYKVDSKKPYQRLKGKAYQCDMDRFHIFIKFPPTSIHTMVDLSEYITVTYALSPDRLTVMIPDPSERGKWYSNNFLVYRETSSKQVRFAYNVPITCTRDRNVFNQEDLQRCVGLCWDRLITSDSTKAHLYYAMLENEQESKNYIEMRSLDYLSIPARGAIANIWRREHPLATPVYQPSDALYYLCETVECTANMINVICDYDHDNPRTVLFRDSERLIKMAYHDLETSMEEDNTVCNTLALHFPGIRFFCGKTMFSVMFGCDAQKQTVIINTNLVDITIREGLVKFYARMSMALPVLMKELYNPELLFSSLVVPPVPPVTPRDEEEYVPEEEEEKQPALLPVSKRPREEEEEEQVIPETRVWSVPLPPQGYDWQFHVHAIPTKRV